jgi:hypothetical protein
MIQSRTISEVIAIFFFYEEIEKVDWIVEKLEF